MFEGLVFGPGGQIDDDTHSYTAGTPLASAVTLPEATSSAVGAITYRLTGPEGPDGEPESVDVAVPGLSFDEATRILSGTPTMAGTVRLTYTARDAANREVEQDFRLVVAGPQLASMATQNYSIGTEITAVELPAAMQTDGTTAYALPLTYTLEDSDGQPVDVAIPGLSFAAGTRMLSGTPTELGTVVLTYTATDSNNNVGELVFSVVVAGPRFPTQEGRAWSAGTPVSVTLDEAVGDGTAAYGRPVTYSLTDSGGQTVDVVVPGVRFDPNTRIISGTPTRRTADILLTYTATDDLGNTGTGNFFVRVDGPTFLGQSPFTFLPAFPASATITTTELYAVALQRDGTTAYGAAVTYSLVNSDGQTVDVAIPGLRFDENTRMLSGTPTTPGSYTFIYSGTDIYGNPVQTIGSGGSPVTYYYVITVTGLQLAAVADQSGSAGSAFTTALPEATGSTAEAVTYSLVNSGGQTVDVAIPGMSFDPATRELSGTPTVVGATPLTYRGAEGTGGNSDTEFFTFTVTGPTLEQPGTNGVVTWGKAGLVRSPAVLTLSAATQSDGTTAYGTTPVYSLADSAGLNVDADPTTGNAVPGLVFDPATRELSGISNMTGTTTLTYTATDSHGNTGMTTFDLVVPGAALTLPSEIDSTSLTVTYTVGNEITSSTFVRPGSTEVFWPGAQTMRLSGGVPNGLEFEPVSGVLSGTPTVAGTTTLTWEVTDSFENTARSTFTVIVNGISLAAITDKTYSVGAELAGTGTLLPPARIGTTAQPDADVTYRISALPPGVSFDESTRVLSGTPIRPMAATSVVYSATDSLGNTAAQTFTVTVGGVTLSIGTATRTYAAGVAATSSTNLPAAVRPTGSTVPLTYAMTTPADRHGNPGLPLAEAVPGLSLEVQASGQPRVTGTPEVTGTTSLSYSVTDSYGNFAAVDVTIVIDTGPTLTQGDLTWAIGATANTILTDATPAGSSTIAELAISTYSVTGADSMPLAEAVPGLSFNPTTRLLSGTLTVAGTTTLTYTATDASGNVVTDSVTVTVSGPTLTAPGAITDTVDGGAIATATLSVAGGVSGGLVLGVTYDVTGTRETSLGDAVPGLSFNPATRVLSGTPTVVGTTTLTYSASISTAAGTSTGTQTFTVTLSGLALPDPTDLTATVGTAIADVTLGEATPASTLTPLVYAVTGPDGTSLGEAVPGLSFAPTTRVLSGTPTRAVTTTLTYTVTDSEDNVSPQEFAVTVGGGVTLGALTMATRTYPVGVALSTGVQLGTASGATTVTYAVEDPADPTVVVDGTPGSAVPGLSFNAAAATRQLSGTPTEPGTYPLIYSATDGNGNRATTPLTVVVTGPVLAAPAAQTVTLGTTFTSITLSAVTRGTTTLTAATDTVTYTLQNSDGLNVNATDSAVPGLSFDTDTRILSGAWSAPVSAPGGVIMLTYSATVSAPCTAPVDSCTATTMFPVTVAEPALGSVLADMTYVAGGAATTITLPALGNVDSGVAVTYTLQDSAGLNVDATATTGNAVPGLVFDTTSRELSGTPTTTNGVFSLTYTATTTTSTTAPVAYTERQIFTVTVVGGPTLDVVEDQTYALGGVIDTLALGARSVSFTGATYTLQDSAGLNVDATATTGNAVPGLVFDTTSRELTGTPTMPGVFSLTYAVTGVGDYSVPSRIFTVTVTEATISTDDRSFPAGTAIAASTTLDEVAGIASGLTVAYTLQDSAGLNVDADMTTGNAVPGLVFDTTSRELSGTPTTPGPTVLAYTAAITATADVVAATTISTTLTFTVTGPALGSVASRTYPAGVAVSSNANLGRATGVADHAMATYAVYAEDDAGNRTPLDGTEDSAVPGLTFTQTPAATGNIAGAFSGTPSVAGTYSLTYSATDQFETEATTPLTVIVTGPALAAVVDQAYTQGAEISPLTLDAAVNAGTTAAYNAGTVTYALTGVPEGLAFDATTRVLSGTPTMTGTFFQLTYTATDSTALDDSEREASQVFRVRVNPPVAFDPNAVADTYTYTNGAALTPLVLPLANGGTGAINYALTDPNGMNLDEAPGLAFDSATRVLDGTPTETVSATVLTYTATDTLMAEGTTTFTVVVEGGGLLLPGASSQTYPDQTYSVGERISTLTLPGTNLTPDDKTYTLTGPGGVALGAAVPGLIFTEAATASATNAGTVSGTPTAVVEATELTYTATEGAESDSFVFTVTVTGAPVFQAGQVDRSYSVGEAVSLTLPAAVSSATPTYTLEPLPDGLIFDPVPRRLHGRPTAPATTELVYTARTAAGAATSLTFSVTVSGLTFASTQADQNVNVGEQLGGSGLGVIVTLPEASGVSGSVTYALTGPDGMALATAVPGLSFDATATARALSGTPTVVGTTVLTYIATDAYFSSRETTPNHFVEQTFRVAVAGTAFEDTVADQSYPVGVQIPLAERLELPEVQAAGTDTLTYSLADLGGNAVVPGLVFDPATRVLSGTPTATGTTVLTYAVTGITTGTVTPQTFSVVVTGGPAFLGDPISDLTYAPGAQIPAMQLPAAAGGHGALTYKLTGVDTAQEIDADGNDMAVDVSGLRFDPGTRQMSGTMGAATVLTYTVTDAGGNTSSQMFALLRLPVGFAGAVPDQLYVVEGGTKTNEDFPIPPLTLPEARLDVEDEDATVTYSLTGPNGTDLSEVGLEFAPVSRVLSGIPVRLPGRTLDKTYLLTYTATDGDSNEVGVLNVRITLVAFTRLTLPEEFSVPVVTYRAREEITPVEFPEATGRVYGTLEYSLVPETGLSEGTGLPPGLSFDPSTRMLTGTPLESSRVFGIRYFACDSAVTNNICSVTDDPFSIAIAPTPYFEGTVEDATYAVGAPITTALALPELLPTGPAYEYELNPWPGGLEFRSNALLGTPTTAGTTELTYTGTHPDTLAKFTRKFTVTVMEGPVFSSEVGNRGFAKDVAITPVRLPTLANGGVVYGGEEDLTYTLTSRGTVMTTGIAGGLSFDSTTTRILSGTPTEDGVTVLTYTVMEDDEEMLSAAQVFTVVVGTNFRPRAIRPSDLPEDVPITRIVDPGGTMTVTVSDYFQDCMREEEDDNCTPEDEVDPLTYESCVLVEAATGSARPAPELVCEGHADALPGAAFVSIVRQDGPILTLSFRSRADAGSEATAVRVTATDAFRTSAVRSLQFEASDGDGGPELSGDPFVDVILTVDSGETTYQEETGNRLCDHFMSDDGVSCSEEYEYRFNVSVADETVASVDLGTEELTTNTSLTLTPNGLGETMVTVTATDMNNRSATGTFLLTVQDRTLASINQVILPEVARAVAGHLADAIAHRMEQARAGIATAGTIGGQTSLASALAAHGEAMQEGTRSLEDLLGDSNFALSLGGGDGEDGTSSVSLWGSGDYRNISGDSEGIKFDGDVLSVHLGADTRLREDVLAGLMVSRSRSDLEYESTSHNGDQELTVTNVSPYVGWSALDGAMDLWASVSYGTGDLEMSYGEDGSAQASSDVEMRTLAAGLSGRVMEFEAGGTLRVKGDALQTTLELDGDDGDLERGSYHANRLRVSAEASMPRATDSGARLEPSVEAGIRHDGGDGNTGSGIELNVGLRHSQPASGITLEGGAYTLVGRDDYQEWGVHGQFRIAAGTAGRGLSLNLSPGYGNIPDGLQKVWQQDAIERGANTRDASMRVDTRLGYGLSALGGQGLLTPYSEITFEETNTYRLGVKWDAGSILRLDLAGKTRDGSAEHEVLLKVEVLF